MAVKSLTKFTFQRFGRAYHLRIDSAQQLADALELDQTHWVATSAPIDTIRSDRTFLEMLDCDHDGRIRAAELKLGVRWLLDHLSDTAGLTQRSTVLSLKAINQQSETGRRIHASVEKMLAHVHQPGSTHISLEQIRRIKADAKGTPVSEAGVVLPEAAGDQATRQLIQDVLGTIGGAAHPSGREGISQQQLDDFLAQVGAYLDWQARGRLDPGQSSSDVLPRGTQTPEAFALLSGLAAKLDQYFAQCRALALDPSLATQLPPRPETLRETDFADPAAIGQLLAAAPLAPPRADGILDRGDVINPHYAPQLEQLWECVLTPLGCTTRRQLSQDKWQAARQRFAAYQSWLKAKPPDGVAALGTERLEACMDHDGAQAVADLIACRRQTAFQLENVRLVEKLVLFQAHMLEFANNFISFPHLYAADSRAMFDVGNLIMDGRRFNLAVKVEHRAEHAAVAAASDMFVLYVHVAAHQNTKPYEVAVPVTAGEQGNLVVGKRGIFEDLDRNQWDARVVQIIENPISLNEAVVAPFKRIAQLIGGKIEQMTSSAEKKLDTTTQQTLTRVETAVTDRPAAAAPSAGGRGLMAGGMLAGGGLALAAVGSALTYIAKAVVNQPVIIIGGVGCAVLAVLLPGLLLAGLKLRRRDLAAVLEGAGWAINARMCLSRPQRRYFTERPAYPSGARGVPTPHRWMRVAIAGLLIVALGVAGWGLWRWLGPGSGPAAAEPAQTQPAATADQEPEPAGADAGLDE